MQTDLGIARDVLQARLERLVEHGILERRRGRTIRCAGDWRPPPRRRRRELGADSDQALDGRVSVQSTRSVRSANSQAPSGWRRLRAEAAPGGVSWSQEAVLFSLHRDGPATISELARGECMRPQSMGASVTALEQLGFVARRNDTDDGRQVLISLIAAGEQALAAARVVKRDWLRGALAQLSADEQRTVAASLVLLRRIIKI